MLRVSNVFTVAGTVFLAIAMVSVIFVITDLLFGGAAATLASIVAGVVFAILWYVLPLTRKALRQ
jgi:hypothetical protein